MTHPQLVLYVFSDIKTEMNFFADVFLCANSECVLPYSKAVMDLLVDLCSRHHLNPSQYSLELKSLETQQPLSYKPNTLIGALDVQTVLLKEKVPEEKIKRPLPRGPEVSTM